MVSPQSRDSKNLPHLQKHLLGHAEEEKQSSCKLLNTLGWEKASDLPTLPFVVVLWPLRDLRNIATARLAAQPRVQVENLLHHLHQLVEPLVAYAVLTRRRQRKQALETQEVPRVGESAAGHAAPSAS